MAQIADNAGLEGNLVVEKVASNKAGFGLNAATGEYEDLVKAGIIDPAKVITCALRNAVSVAGVFVTTECLVTDIPKPPAKEGGNAPGGH
jgi:chaperonin GroEL